MNRLRLLVLALAASACAACAHAPPPGSSAPRRPEVDDSTLALWRFDESTGARLVDSGPLRLAGLLGLDTQPEFGRFGKARAFQRSVNSFAFVPATTALDLDATWRIEAWIYVEDYGRLEFTGLAVRWNPGANEQSWALGLTGRNFTALPLGTTRPDWFTTLLSGRLPGLVVFVLQPEKAGDPRAYISTRPVEPERWTHVAVTDDGSTLRIYLDGRLDAQYAVVGRVRPSPAPLVIGNAFDPHWLEESGGTLRVPDQLGAQPSYAFEGRIDELKISASARLPGE